MPGRNVSVPARAVKSSPAVAVPFVSVVKSTVAASSSPPVRVTVMRATTPFSDAWKLAEAKLIVLSFSRIVTTALLGAPIVAPPVAPESDTMNRRSTLATLLSFTGIKICFTLSALAKFSVPLVAA